MRLCACSLESYMRSRACNLGSYMRACACKPWHLTCACVRVNLASPHLHVCKVCYHQKPSAGGLQIPMGKLINSDCHICNFMASVPKALKPKIKTLEPCSNKDPSYMRTRACNTHSSTCARVRVGAPFPHLALHAHACVSCCFFYYEL